MVERSVGRWDDIGLFFSIIGNGIFGHFISEDLTIAFKAHFRLANDDFFVLRDSC